MARNDGELERLLGRYELMHRIRAFEETAAQAQRDGEVLGTIHPSIGQEAIAAGLVTQLAPDDLLLSTHRGHGHTMAKGADPDAMMHELLGRAAGVCAGKGGSMHIADFGVGMLGANGVVAANIVIAAGAAHAIKLAGERRIVCCIFGDGAINRGPFLEGLNWAAVHRLPVLFVCENNGYAATTRADSMTAGPGAKARAESIGIESHETDGNDVLALEGLGRELVDAVRASGTPRFLLAHTTRLTGHTAIDPGAYRPEGEVDAAWARDPIRRLGDHMLDEGVPESELQRRGERAYAAIAALFERARAAPWPASETIAADVQDVGAPVRIAGGR